MVFNTWSRQRWRLSWLIRSSRWQMCTSVVSPSRSTRTRC